MRYCARAVVWNSYRIRRERRCAEAMATIEIDRVTKVYGNGFVAVDDVSLSIGDGEFIVLVGPSGCGKSTLLRMIAGLEEVTAGEVRIGGRDVTDLAPRHRDIAMVFQNYALYPHMTVRENLGYGLKVRRLRRPRRGDASTRSRACSGSTSCSTGSRRSSPAGSASASRWGARSCASRGRSSWTSRCRTSTRSSASAMRASLAQLHAKLGVTTIYVTHDQTEAMTLGPARRRHARRADRPGRRAAGALPRSRGTSSSPRSSARRR